MPGGLPIHFTLFNIVLLIFLFPIFFIPVELIEYLGNIGYHHHDSHYFDK